MRYVVEGIWDRNGKCCHRRVIAWGRKDLEKISTIEFTDGTHMNVSVRPAKPRERVEEIGGYDELLGKCVTQKKTGHIKVMDIKWSCGALT